MKKSYAVKDTFADTLICVDSRNDAFSLIERLEAEDKYMGLYRKNRYRIIGRINHELYRSR